MMTFSNQLDDQERYRVILVMPFSRMVLAERHGKALRLPRINIPKWTRPAERLNEAVQAKWNIKSVIIDILSKEESTVPCAVAEVSRHSCISFANGFITVPVDDFDRQELTATEHLTVRSILAGNRRGGRPFSRLGWIDEAQHWIRESVRHHVVEFSEDILQLNASANFALVRFGTQEGPAYWLKATGMPNRHEYAVTTTLAEYFPDSLPPMVAAREDWNAWVTEEAGQPLCNCLTQRVLQEAIRALAKLQRQSTFRVGQLLAVGCFDGRIPVLRTHLSELIDYLEESMEQQTSLNVPRLHRNRLRELGSILHDACSEMHELGIPDSLILNDVNLGNILFDGSRCVFIDWAEACVGNPFLTCQQLFVGAVRSNGEACTWIHQLKAFYKAQWPDTACEAKLDRAFALAPLLTIVSYLYGRGDWLQSPRRYDLHFQSYSRSLARHMDRAAQAPELMEGLCH
ncbi:phosphotransferase [Tunturiibacter gelidoferens]|uniref:Aminoglycoside phosphotransferase domain-containing protein n=1 Tax=Tunturiibacter gelidiferens TaxID=3069689 RepID=A0AAU7YZV6_9BACT